MGLTIPCFKYWAAAQLRWLMNTASRKTINQTETPDTIGAKVRCGSWGFFFIRGEASVSPNPKYKQLNLTQPYISLFF